MSVKSLAPAPLSKPAQAPDRPSSATTRPSSARPASGGDKNQSASSKSAASQNAANAAAGKNVANADAGGSKPRGNSAGGNRPDSGGRKRYANDSDAEAEEEEKQRKKKLEEQGTSVTLADMKELKHKKLVLPPHDKLVQASKRGDLEKLKELVFSYDRDYDVRDYLNAPDQAGSHSVMHTVWPGHVQALEFLLLSRGDPSKQNNRLNTALHLACERKNKDVIRLLITYGADTQLRNAQKQLCWEMSAATTPQERNADEAAMRAFVERCVQERKSGSYVSYSFEMPHPDAITPFKPEYYAGK